MSGELDRCHPGWSARRSWGFAQFTAPDGYVVIEGDGWGDENGDGAEEVWYAYCPNDLDHARPIGGADWPHLDDAVNAVERHRVAQSKGSNAISGDVGGAT